MEQAYQHVRICPNESREGGFHLELCANKSMPFDLQASSNAVWHHFTRSIKHMPRRVYVPLVCVISVIPWTDCMVVLSTNSLLGYRDERSRATQWSRAS